MEFLGEGINDAVHTAAMARAFRAKFEGVDAQLKLMIECGGDPRQIIMELEAKLHSLCDA